MYFGVFKLFYKTCSCYFHFKKLERLHTTLSKNKYNVRFVVLISDPAKSNNTHDLIVYSALESAVVLTVKFHMNPVNNYTAFWSMDGLELEHANVRDKVKGQQVQTTYFISDLTEEQLGNYTVQVINWDITSKQKEATFNVILKLSGKSSSAKSFYPVLSQTPVWHMFDNKKV